MQRRKIRLKKGKRKKPMAKAGPAVEKPSPGTGAEKAPKNHGRAGFNRTGAELAEFQRIYEGLEKRKYKAFAKEAARIKARAKREAELGFCSDR